MAQLTSPDQLSAAHMPLSQPFPRVYTLASCNADKNCSGKKSKANQGSQARATGQSRRSYHHHHHHRRMEADAATAAAAARGMEAEIEKALRARVPFFKKQAE